MEDGWSYGKMAGQTKRGTNGQAEGQKDVSIRTDGLSQMDGRTLMDGRILNDGRTESDGRTNFKRTGRWMGGPASERTDGHRDGRIDERMG